MSQGAAAGVLAIERYVPPHRYEQAEIAGWVRRWLEEEPSTASRLLSVYDTAGVNTRGAVAPIEEVFAPPELDVQARRYERVAREAGIDVVRRALAAADLPAGDVDLLVSISCTGFMIPALDAYVADALGMGPRLARLPITESGCAGGVVGIARARDYLVAHPDRAAVVVAMELSSLTFQRWDRSPANVVSTAIFGDGGAAVVLVGAEHERAAEARVRVRAAESVFFPGTTHLMGFNLRNQGLQIVLDRQLSGFIRKNVVSAVDGFLAEQGVSRSDVLRWILHPGGRRIIDVMTEKLELGEADLAPTRRVLAEHGNMSSVTVLFVLDELLRSHSAPPGSLGVLGAFGPGFGAELALLEFC